METDIEKIMVQDIQNQIVGQVYQRLSVMDPTGDSPQVSQAIYQDINGPPYPRDSIPYVDACPDVSYLNEHLVAPYGLSMTSRHIDPSCDVLMPQVTHEEHAELAKSQACSDGFHCFTDFNTPIENLKTYDFHMGPHLIEPECDMFIPQHCHIADSSPSLHFLDKHLVTHTAEGPLKLSQYKWRDCPDCPRCIEGFNHENELTSHMGMSHAEETHLRQSILGSDDPMVNFQGVKNIEEPVVPSMHVKPHRCSECGVRFRQLSILDQHMFLHDISHPYRNDSHVKSAKKRHLETSDSGRKFKRQKYLQGKRPYKCSVCHEEFRYSYLWTDHLLTHTEDSKGPILVSSTAEKNNRKRQYTCALCNMMFGRSARLDRHVLRVHSAQTATEGMQKFILYNWHQCHECSHCIEGFTYEHDLTAHMGTHKVENPRLQSDCNIAGYACASQEAFVTKECIPNVMNKPHICPVCGIRFRKSAVFKQHMLLHKTTIPKVCPKYGNDLISPRKSRHHHDIKVTKKKRFKCSHCSCKFSKRKHFKEHIKKHKGKRLYKCSFCHEEFSHLDDLRKHVRHHSGYKLYMSSVCNKRFKHSSSLKKHVLICKGRNTHKHSAGNKKLRPSSHTSKNDLHQSMVQTKEPFDSLTYKWDECHACPQCIKGFYLSHELTAHMATHKVETPPNLQQYKCVSEIKSLSCSHCGKVFSKQRRLNQHLLSHTGVKPYKCLVCNKAFTRSSRLDVHMRIHTKEKPHKCSLCAKEFRRSKSLKTHMKKHLVRSGMNSVSGSVKPQDYIRSYSAGTNTRENTKMLNAQSCNTECGENVGKLQCPVCEMVFGIPSDLGAHMLLHSTGDSSHECCVCNRLFSFRHNLRMHMRIHTGEKPDKCSVCGKHFRSPSNLREHMMIHTGNMPHKCPVCHKGFLRSRNFRRHMLRHRETQSPKHSVIKRNYGYSAEIHKGTYTHINAKRHICTICNKAFGIFSKFVKHMEVHTRERWKETGKKTGVEPKDCHCVYCKRLYKSQSSFDRHLNWSCKLCKQRFCKLSLLNTHMKTHNGGT